MVVGKVKGGGQIIVDDNNGTDNIAVVSGGNGKGNGNSSRSASGSGSSSRNESRSGNGKSSAVHDTYGGGATIPGSKEGSGNGNGKKAAW
jgi:spartin